jgi:sugar phosphate isomerase/epimerase
VDAALAKKVQNGDLTYTEAVRRGMYQILGEGDVDIAGVIHELESNGYTGWYVLEQDPRWRTTGCRSCSRSRGQRQLCAFDPFRQLIQVSGTLVAPCR